MAATVTHLSNGVNQSGANVYVGFAAKDVNRQTLSTPDGDLTITTDSYYYDDSDEERSSVPTKLRYCYRYGAQKEIEFKSTAAWTVRYASIADVNADWGAVKGQIWMEEDGLHATIENATAYPLKDGYLLTALGYCKVPEILPGQIAEAAILEWKDRRRKNPPETAMATAPSTESSYILPRRPPPARARCRRPATIRKRWTCTV